MYAVLEEVENGIACLIPDSTEKPFYIPVKNLPQSYEIGDVFFVEKKPDNQLYLKIDKNEKEKRLALNKMKRERLLSKSTKEQERDRKG